MVQYTIYTQTSILPAIVPAIYVDDPVAGEVIDAKFYNDVAFICSAGVLQGTVDWKIEHGSEDNLSDAAAVTGAVSTQFVADTDNGKVTRLHVSRTTFPTLKRYVRVYATLEVTAEDTPISAVAVLHNPLPVLSTPITQDPGLTVAGATV
jgi:hypothetical protein